MPTYEFQTKDGRKFQFDAPDQLTALSKWNAAQPQVNKADRLVPSNGADHAPDAPSATLGGVTTQGMSGVNEGISNALGFPVDAVNSALGVFGLGSKQPAMGSDFWKNVLAPTIKPPSNIPGEDVARSVGQGVGSAAVAGPALGGGLIPSMVSGGVGAAASEGAKALGAPPIVQDVAGLVGGGVGGARNIGRTSWFRRPPAVPTEQELRAAGVAGADTARGLGVNYTPAAVSQTVTTARQAMEADGIVAPLAPKTYAIINALENPPAGAVAAPYTGGVDAARKALGRVRSDYGAGTSGEDREAARRMVQALDTFVEGPGVQNAISGNAAALADTARNSRGNFAASFRSRELGGEFTGIGDNATLRSGATNSGTNLDNAIRQRVVSLLQDDTRRAAFTPEEQQFLRQVAQGTAGINALRWFGNMLGGAGGRAAGASAAVGSALGGMGGAVTGGPAGAAIGAAVGTSVIPTVGYTLKRFENAATRRALGNVDEATRARSPLYQQRQAAAPTGPASPQDRAAIIRSLLLGIGQPQVSVQQ